MIKSKTYQILLLVLILLFGLSLRLNNLNWDQGFHLQPDERFLTMVGNDIKIPKSLFDYLNPKTSSLNPYNNNYNFFVYGTFPVILNKAIAVIFNNDNYFDFTTQGRLLSGLTDALIILFVYKVLALFENKYKFDKSIKYWGAFFYSIMVLPIQLSHFFAVDTFMNLFIFLSFYFALKYSLFGRNSNIFLSSIFLGIGVASKISAVLILPLVSYFIWVKNINLKKFFKINFIYFVILYFTLRIFNPYLFENSNFLNPKISKLFIDNIKTLKSYESFNIWYPPAIQWMNKIPISFSLNNLIFFGVGAIIFFFFLYGVFSALKLRKKSLLKVIFIWLFGVFIFQSVQFVKVMRYLLLIYPFIAIFAGMGVYYLGKFFKKKNYLNIYISTVIFLVLIWPLSYSQIYNKAHSRIEASKWIYNNIESEKVILTESWDDSLPLLIENNTTKVYKNLQLPVFDMDTEQKWNKMNEMLNNGDYLILSSNRGWGSITNVPEKYPIMSRFYKDLLQNKLNYKKIKEISSYPEFYLSGLNIQFDDSTADESFTVYDHPKIMIFKKEKTL